MVGYCSGSIPVTHTQRKGVMRDMGSRIRFRSKRMNDLARNAVQQGFAQVTRGSGHEALICPRCGKHTVLSSSQRDNDSRRYLNVESRLRNHGLKVENKPVKGCKEVDTETQSVYVVIRPHWFPNRVYAVASTLRAAKRLASDGYKSEHVGNPIDGWWVESEKNYGQKFELNSGRLMLYDYSYSDTEWCIEWREIEDPVRV